MKGFFSVSLVMLALVASSALSGDAPAPAKPADLEEQVKTLTAKLEVLEKRIAELERMNGKLLETIREQSGHSGVEQPVDPIVNPKQMLLQRAWQEQRQLKDAKKQPKFHLLNYTELGVPFDVERAMLGDALQQERQLQQFVPRQYEYKAEPGTAIPQLRK